VSGPDKYLIRPAYLSRKASRTSTIKAINMTTLAQLHVDIDARVQTILEDRSDWLCGKGCDSCCRRLANVPLLTLAEWGLLREGLVNLAPERLLEIRSNMASLTSQHSRLITCPMLDLSTGTCPVYAQRPVACRTYCFYVQRDQGLYCHDIESLVDEGALADVVWGNHDAIDHRLASLGETRPLTDWFDHWIEGNGSGETAS
jgi:Fe-S-cluster containining protein